MLLSGEKCAGGIWFILEHMSTSGESNDSNRGTHIFSIFQFPKNKNKKFLSIHDFAQFASLWIGSNTYISSVFPRANKPSIAESGSLNFPCVS